MDDLLTHPVTGAGHFAVDDRGTLFYAGRRAAFETRAIQRLDRAGEIETIALESGPRLVGARHGIRCQLTPGSGNPR